MMNYYDNLLHIVAPTLEHETKTVSCLIWVADFVDFTAKSQQFAAAT